MRSANWNQSTRNRVFGVETEFGTLVADENLGGPDNAVEIIKDYVFQELKLGVVDIHARDEVFEPAMSGGFLVNGARLYIDAVGSHLEYATAECRSLKDLVANDRAGHRQIVRAIREMGLSDEFSVYNNAVDHFGGHTFGCHENYMVRADQDLFNSELNHLFPFLVTRQIYAGVGRVGGHVLTAGGRPSNRDVALNPIDYIWVSHIYGVEPDETVEFQLSQRADHILNLIASRVRFNRAMINPKWDHFYSHNGMTRLHLLFGESNQNQFAYAMKVGTTTLAIRLLEDGLIPDHVNLLNPLMALREISRDPSFEWRVDLEDGGRASAIEIQRAYLEAAQVYRDDDEQTNWILDQWSTLLDELESDPMKLGHKIDWVAKRVIVDLYRDEEKLTWQDPALQSIDLEYHNIDPEKSLFEGYRQQYGVEEIASEVDILTAITDPPEDTRALGRGKLVEQVIKRNNRKFYVFDWNGVAIDRHNYIDMPDPLCTYENPVSRPVHIEFE